MPAIDLHSAADGTPIPMDRTACLVLMWNTWCRASPRAIAFLARLQAEISGELKAYTCTESASPSEARSALDSMQSWHIPNTTHGFVAPGQFAQWGLAYVPEFMLVWKGCGIV